MTSLSTGTTGPHGKTGAGQTNGTRPMNFAKKRSLAFLIGVGLFAVFFALAYKLGWIGGEKSSSITYRPVRVERVSLDVKILATGTVQPENRLEIKPPISGRVEKVLAEEGQMVHKGQVLAWMSSTERAALLDAASAQGIEELKRWEDIYKATPVIAPIGGMIIRRNVEAGQSFGNADAVFVISDRLTVKAQVDETDIASIKKSQSADIVLDAYPKRHLPARVDQIAFEAKTTNNVTTYIVDVLPDSTPSFMRSGMTANVTIHVDSKKNILGLPMDAIKQKESESGVWVSSLTDPQKPEDVVWRPIEIGASDGQYTEIISGLSEGENIFVPQVAAEAPKSNASNPLNPFGAMRRPPGLRGGGGGGSGGGGGRGSGGHP